MAHGFLSMLDSLIASAEAETADEDLEAGMAESDPGESGDKDFDRALALEQGTMNYAEDGPVQVLVRTEDGPVAVVEDSALQAAASASEAARDEKALIAEFRMPEPFEYRSKGERYKLVFDGVCTHCAHCGQPLTDSESIERGIGPVCSKKGYFEDPKSADEIGAMVALAEFPALAEYVSAVYRPQGARKMMNFLVKLCALNRRSPVHLACTDAIEALGYDRLASTLRESVAIVEVSPRKADPSTFLVWIKRSEWTPAWTHALRGLSGSHAAPRSSGEKGTIVPKRHKRALWEMMQRYYTGYCAKVPRKDGTGQVTIRIREKSLAETSDSGAEEASTSSD